MAAGHERAVAATKTYTAELLALLLLVEGIRAGDGALPAEERGRARRAARARRTRARRPTAATSSPQRYRFADRLVTTGRGYAYPTAREAALKLMETSYLAGARLLRRRPAARPARDDRPGRAGARRRRRRARRHSRCATCSHRLGERRADVVVVGAADGRARRRLAVPGRRRAVRPAAGHPAAAAAGAGPGAGPRRGPRRAREA